ncbi:MAG TPA: NUDIX domain-containing protein [Sphingomicrobium sp.]|nr:NUDIX domain-containing protein [Sphingomicrobium sp.]
MPQPLSAGILLFREREGRTEVLLIRPGGPFWRNKREGAWMIPKGALEPGETASDAAIREFEEEIGHQLESVPFALCSVRQAGGKQVEVFAVEGDLDPASISSIHFEMEWPPRSGQFQSFPEAEAARWMPIFEARRMMLPSQLPILDALEARLANERRSS